MDLDNILSSFFNGLAHTTTKLDKNLHNNEPELKDSLVDNFLHELNDFLYNNRDLYRLKQMPEDTLFRISDDTETYFSTIVDSNSKNFPRLNGFADQIFYIPKKLCDLNIDESLYKVEDLRLEEINYKNYLQLKDGVYKVVDKDGNVLQ